MKFKERNQSGNTQMLRMPLVNKGKKYLYSDKLEKEMTCIEILNYNRNLKYNVLKSILKIREIYRKELPILKTINSLHAKGMSDSDIVNNFNVTFKNVN